jgi:hypothetical protein
MSAIERQPPKNAAHFFRAPLLANHRHQYRLKAATLGVYLHCTSGILARTSQNPLLGNAYSNPKFDLESGLYRPSRSFTSNLSHPAIRPEPESKPPVNANRQLVNREPTARSFSNWPTLSSVSIS